MKKPASKWREISLLAVPMLAILAWCAWLQFRQPFKLTIDGITVALVPPQKMPGASERQVTVEVFLDHEGMRPSWWGEQPNLRHPRVHFTGKGEQDDDSNVGSYLKPEYDETRGQYRFLYYGWVPASPDYLKTATCHVFTGLETTRVPTKVLATTDKISIPASQFKVPTEIKTTMP